MNTPIVYVLECDGFFKIGYTRNSIEDRIRSFQHGNPHLIVLHSSYMLEDAYRLEKYLHTRFEKLLVRGEWFTLDMKDIEEIPLYVYEFNTIDNHIIR